jgi:hypothetical protein
MTACSCLCCCLPPRSRTEALSRQTAAKSPTLTQSCRLSWQVGQAGRFSHPGKMQALRANSCRGHRRLQLYPVEPKLPRCAELSSVSSAVLHLLPRWNLVLQAMTWRLCATWRARRGGCWRGRKPSRCLLVHFLRAVHRVQLPCHLFSSNLLLCRQRSRATGACLADQPRLASLCRIEPGPGLSWPSLPHA